MENKKHIQSKIVSDYYVMNSGEQFGTIVDAIVRTAAKIPVYLKIQ